MENRILKVFRHGVTGGTLPRISDHDRGQRSEVSGWSARSSRSNVAFLRSVDYEKVDTDSDGNPLTGFALTLTVKDCPPTHEHWKKVREAFFLRLRKYKSLYRSHWVTEWQRRGVPHLHGAFYFPSHLVTDEFKQEVISAWLGAAKNYSPLHRSQYLTPIHDALGWCQYTAKHMARGFRNYQRCKENIPASWNEKTGRIWGKTGDWPTTPPAEIYLGDDCFYRLRRIVRRWRIAQHRHAFYSRIENHGLSDFRRVFPDSSDFRSRALLDSARQFLLHHPEYRPYRMKIKAARLMFRGKDRKTSDVRGFSEWIPSDLILDMATAAKAICLDREEDSPLAD